MMSLLKSMFVYFITFFYLYELRNLCTQIFICFFLVVTDHGTFETLLERGENQRRPEPTRPSRFYMRWCEVNVVVYLIKSANKL